MLKLLVLHNIASSYYKNIVFNALYKKFKNFKVIYFSETKSNRKWDIDLSYLNYKYSILFKGDFDTISGLSQARAIIKALKKEKFDIIYLGGYSDIANWVALIYSKLKRKKVIIEMNSNNFSLGGRKIYKEFLKKKFIGLCDFALSYGTLSKKYLIELGMPENRIFIKPNVTDNDFWERETKKYSIRRREILKDKGYKSRNFIFVGRFSEEKNLFFLLKAFNEAKKIISNENWGLILVGDGHLKEVLQSFVKKNEIKDVFFVPFKQKKELPEFYAISDVLVLPSLSEPWGIVVNEAMASGVIPLISNRCGAADMVVHDENGYMFNPKDIDSIISIIKEIMKKDDEIERLKLLNKKRINSVTSDSAAEVIIESVYKTYESH